jgi:hypothetical protein
MSARFTHAQQTHTPSRRAVVRAVHRCDLFLSLSLFFSFFLSACLLSPYQMKGLCIFVCLWEWGWRDGWWWWWWSGRALNWGLALQECRTGLQIGRIRVGCAQACHQQWGAFQICGHVGWMDFCAHGHSESSSTRRQEQYSVVSLSLLDTWMDGWMDGWSEFLCHLRQCCCCHPPLHWLRRRGGFSPGNLKFFRAYRAPHQFFLWVMPRGPW